MSDSDFAKRLRKGQDEENGKRSEALREAHIILQSMQQSTSNGNGVQAYNGFHEGSSGNTRVIPVDPALEEAASSFMNMLQDTMTT